MHFPLFFCFNPRILRDAAMTFSSAAASSMLQPTHPLWDAILGNQPMKMLNICFNSRTPGVRYPFEI
jgi:hypothetical protein